MRVNAKTTALAAAIAVIMFAGSNQAQAVVIDTQGANVAALVGTADSAGGATDGLHGAVTVGGLTMDLAHASGAGHGWWGPGIGQNALGSQGGGQWLRNPDRFDVIFTGDPTVVSAKLVGAAFRWFNDGNPVLGNDDGEAVVVSNGTDPSVTMDYSTITSYAGGTSFIAITPYDVPLDGVTPLVLQVQNTPGAWPADTWVIANLQFDVTYVPEPSSIGLLMIGGLGLVLRRRR